ncbi:Pycsar system effector family protein [Micromonospora aurantiaca (nom. illeg.)]|uniref:Pycsar system effector family protein n=1 Tax=Micromonospora aurantiaca (nom. illeg.) TaxID=47850 RepID=UPI000F3C5BAC|nr:Pycsar system effector family protein [Micromonospora aurantiaca]RNH98587.1 hypothetical protein EEZ25_26155 [Micromonospora aurantiaca]
MVLWSRRQSDAASVAAVPAPVNVEVGWQILSIVNDWTKHAEGKAVAVLAASGVLGSLLYTLVKGTGRLPMAVVVTALVSASLLLLAGTCAGIALRPRLRTVGQPTNPLFYDHVARRHRDGPQSYRLVLAALANDSKTLLDAVADQIWATSRTARTKYRWANRALVLLMLATASLVLTAVLTIATS